MEGRFHLAFATTDLKRVKAFYGGFLGLKEGRNAATWVDYDFFGNQLTIQEVPMLIKTAKVYNPQSPSSPAGVPANHWGVVLNISDWRLLRDKLTKVGVPFQIEPNTVMKGQVGEQRSLFIEDPDGNAIEFKAMLEDGNLFRKA